MVSKVCITDNYVSNGHKTRLKNTDKLSFFFFLRFYFYTSLNLVKESQVLNQRTVLIGTCRAFRCRLNFTVLYPILGEIRLFFHTNTH